MKKPYYIINNNHLPIKRLGFEQDVLFLLETELYESGLIQWKCKTQSGSIIYLNNQTDTIANYE